MLGELAGHRQLLVQTRQELTGIDPLSGEQLWSVAIPAFRGMNILKPLIVGDGVFTCSYGGGAFLHTIRRNSDGWQVNQVWTSKTEGYMSSPVLIGDDIYIHLKNQRFACIDPATGLEMWRSKPFGKYWSMAVNGSQILALDQRGEMLVVESGRQDSSTCRITVQTKRSSAVPASSSKLTAVRQTSAVAESLRRRKCHSHTSPDLPAPKCVRWAPPERSTGCPQAAPDRHATDTPKLPG